MSQSVFWPPGGGASPNASVGTNGNVAPVSSTEIGFVNGSGNLTPVSPTNALPVTPASGATFNENLTLIGGNPVNVGSGAADTGTLRIILSTDSPLATGASTSALQTSGNANLTSIDGKTPALGQALAATSVPVVLTAAQLTTLTPLSSVTVTQPTGANLHTVVDSGTVAISGTPNVAVTSSVLPTGASTSALQTTGNTSLASIDSKVPVLGQALAAASVPVVLTSAQLAAITPLTTVSVTQPVGTNLHAVVDSGTIAVSNFPASQPVSGTVTVVQPTGTNLHTVVDSGSVAITSLASSGNTLVIGTSGNVLVSGLAAVGTVPSLNPVSVAGVDGGGLKRHFLTDTSGRLEIDTVQSLPLPVGASTSANQATEIASLATIATNSGAQATAGNQVNGNQKTQVVDAAGITAGPVLALSGVNYFPVTLAASATAGNASPVRAISIAGKDGSGNAQVIAVNTSGQIITASSSSVGRTSVALARNDYGTTPVTTAAYVQLIASTSAVSSLCELFDSSGQTLVLALGAVGSEVNQFYINPGGNGQVSLNIPVGSRVSIKAVTASATAGYINLNLYS